MLDVISIINISIILYVVICNEKLSKSCLAVISFRQGVLEGISFAKLVVVVFQLASLLQIQVVV